MTTKCSSQSKNKTQIGFELYYSCPLIPDNKASYEKIEKSCGKITDSLLISDYVVGEKG